MVTVAPSDQAARQRIHTDLQSTLFVEAGAGTGNAGSAGSVGIVEQVVA